MNKQGSIILKAILAMVILIGAFANLAQASESKEKEAKELTLFSQAKISLTEAINLHSQLTPHTITSAEIR